MIGKDGSPGDIVAFQQNVDDGYPVPVRQAPTSRFASQEVNDSSVGVILGWPVDVPMYDPTDKSLMHTYYLVMCGDTVGWISSLWIVST